MKRFLKTAVIFAACATLFAACQKETPIEDDSPASYQGEDPAKTETPADNNQSGNVTNPSSGTVIPSTGNNSGTVGNNDNIPADYNFGDVPFDKSELYVDKNVEDVVFSKGDWIMIANTEFNDVIANMEYSVNDYHGTILERDNGSNHSIIYFTVSEDETTITITKAVQTANDNIVFNFDENNENDEWSYSIIRDVLESNGYTFSGTTATLDVQNKDITESCQNLTKAYPYAILDSYKYINESIKTNPENTKYYNNYPASSMHNYVSGTGLIEIYIMKK